MHYKHCDFGGCTRGEIYVALKAWNTHTPWFNRMKNIFSTWMGLVIHLAVPASFGFSCWFLGIIQMAPHQQLQHNWFVASLGQTGHVLGPILTQKSFTLWKRLFRKMYHPSPRSPRLAPLLPLGCVIDCTLWAMVGEQFVQGEGHCQRAEISLSPGSGHNTPLFTLKPKVSPCWLCMSSSWGSPRVWTVLIGFVCASAWQFTTDSLWLSLRESFLLSVLLMPFQVM